MENKLSPSLIQEFLKMRQRVGELEALRTENAKLHELFRDLSALLSSVGDLACIMDAGGSILFMNEPENFCSIKQELYSGRPFHSIFNEQSSKRSQEAFLAALSGNTVKCILRLPGGEIWECKYTPFMNETGRTSGVIFTARDITRDTAAEGQLKTYIALLESMVKIKTEEADMARDAIKDALSGLFNARREAVDLEAFFSDVLNSADPVFLADESGRIVFANAKAGELMGVPAEKIIGVQQMELHPEEDSELYSSVFAEGFLREEARFKDLLIRRADGADIPVEIVSGKIRLNGKEFIYGIFRPLAAVKISKKDADTVVQSQNFTMWPLQLKRAGGYGNA